MNSLFAQRRPEHFQGDLFGLINMAVYAGLGDAELGVIPYGARDHVIERGTVLARAAGHTVRFYYPNLTQPDIRPTILDHNFTNDQQGEQ